MSEIERLKAVLARFVEVEEDECRYDHNGFCQAHYSSRPCRYEEAMECLRSNE